ncbi:hypothetical protein JOL62DRAFT_364559 [Phyllosticta paracitricarpa]|uniref:Transmembrane protein n=1 Tax=Phyllosticta paracitricarpa TaxID=2016321 RepID=A0ABR1MUR8_9PEZI
MTDTTATGTHERTKGHVTRLRANLTSHVDMDGTTGRLTKRVFPLNLFVWLFCFSFYIFFEMKERERVELAVEERCDDERQGQEAALGVSCARARLVLGQKLIRSFFPRANDRIGRRTGQHSYTHAHDSTPTSAASSATFSSSSQPSFSGQTPLCPFLSPNQLFRLAGWLFFFFFFFFSLPSYCWTVSFLLTSALMWLSVWLAGRFPPPFVLEAGVVC